MNFQEYKDKINKLEENLLEYIKEDDSKEENYQNLINFLEEQKIKSNKENLRTFLYLLANIASHHHRYSNFFDKIGQIVIYLKESLLNFFSNYEIFKIFKSNRRFLLLAIEEKIVTIDSDVFLCMLNFKFEYYYIQYFSPELATFNDPSMKTNLILDFYSELPKDFYEKRRIGENDDFVSKIIREDSIDEFISFVKKEDYSLESKIINSVYETNSYLSKVIQISLIEYAAYFGSTQIFKYLYQNGVKLDEQLWLYAIHGDDPEIIHILEEEKPIKLQEIHIKECIKCHHNHILNYMMTNYSDKENDYENIDCKQNYRRNIVRHCFHYYNFCFLPDKINNQADFLYACQYDHFSIARYMLNTFKIDINETTKDNSYWKTYHSPLINAARKDNQDIIELLMSVEGIEIGDKCFLRCRNLTEINISSNVTSIGTAAFNGCILLAKVTMASSVTSIGECAFYGCSSLKEISLSSSLKSIENETFSRCKSLKEIVIPPSVTSIGKGAFEECTSLAEVTIPPSVASIGEYAFMKCHSLKEITIPPSVISIGQLAFEDCDSLEKVTIPSEFKNKINKIGLYNVKVIYT